MSEEGPYTQLSFEPHMAHTPVPHAARTSINSCFFFYCQQTAHHSHPTTDLPPPANLGVPFLPRPKTWSPSSNFRTSILLITSMTPLPMTPAGHLLCLQLSDAHTTLCCTSLVIGFYRFCVTPSFFTWMGPAFTSRL